MDLLNINRPWDCQAFPKSKTIIYGGSGGGGWGFPTSNSVSNTVTPVVNTVVEPVVEIVEPVAETVEDAGEVAQLMVDVAHSVVTGEPQGYVEDLQEAPEEIKEAYEDAGESYQEGLDNISDAATETINTSNEVIADIGTNVSEQFSEAMGLTDETQGGDVSEETRGGDIIRDEELLQLDTKKSALKAKKKRGKKGLRIDYATNIPGMGKSGLAA